MIINIFLSLVIIISFLLGYSIQKSLSFSNYITKTELNDVNEKDNHISKEVILFLLNIINETENFFDDDEYLEQFRVLLKEDYDIDDKEFNLLVDIFKTIDENGYMDEVINIFDEKYEFQEAMDVMSEILDTCPDLTDLIIELNKQDLDIINIVNILIDTDDTNVDLDTFINDFKDKFPILVNFTLHVIQYSDDDVELFEYISDFIYENQDLIEELLEYLENNTDVLETIIAAPKTEEYQRIKKQILKEDNLLTIIKIFIENKDLLIKFADMLRTVEKSEHLFVKIVQFLIDNDKFDEVYRKILDYFINNKEQAKILISLLNIFFRELLDIYAMQHQEELEKYISLDCREFLNYTLLGYVDGNNTNNFSNWNYDKNISSYYLYKFIVDTTKDKNQLLTYENCLDAPPNFQGIQKSDLQYKYNNNFPTFIISVIDFSDRHNLIINSTFFENYYFIVGSCLPQGKKNTSGFYCQKSDYEYMTNRFMKIFLDVEGMKITPIEINRENDTVDLTLKVIFPLIIFFIPLFIYFFLIFYRNIVLKKRKNVIIINNNNKNHENEEGEDEENDRISKEDNEQLNKISQRNVKIVPKWYKLLYEFFNFKENFKELFNFESQKTSINDTRGLNNIQGILGISIVLTILGQLYFIFFNLPMKTFGNYDFYDFISKPVYVFSLIGLRYSPRVIFSCSGYTLVYKFLSFIEQGNSYYFLKFFSYQFYKYVILIIFILNLRYSLYFLISCMFDVRPMWKVLYEQELKMPEKFGDFILGLINLSFIDKDEGVFNHNIFNYFWMQFNEMNFFTTGIIILSIGYKKKYRIDYLIIVLIILMFFGKIIFFYCHNKYDKRLYTTLYYYLFDYGYYMLNPFFNFNYFLIGMYFGLINYSLQNDIKIFQQDKAKEVNELKRIINDSEIESSGKSSIFSNSISIETQSKDENKDNYNIIDNDDFDEKKENQINEIKNLKCSLNSNGNNDNINSKIYTKEIESMPFLKSTISIIEWHRKKNTGYCLNILIVSLFIMVLVFSFTYFGFIIYYEKKIDNKSTNAKDYGESDKLYQKLSLHNVIANDYLNFLYLIDIDFVIFFIQWGFFILLMKGQFFINNFFSHYYWSVFTKSYFSFLMVCNTIILFVFYESETVVKLNLLNILLYFCINSVFIFLFTIVMYIYLELPMKKIFKYIVKKDIQILNIEEEIDDEEEEEEELNEDNLITPMGNNENDENQIDINE